MLPKGRATPPSASPLQVARLFVVQLSGDQRVRQNGIPNLGRMIGRVCMIFSVCLAAVAVLLLVLAAW